MSRLLHERMSDLQNWNMYFSVVISRMSGREMNALYRRSVATRELSYRTIGGSELKAFTIRISEPYLLDPAEVDYPITEGTAGCTVSFDGLPERDQSVTGADTFQALELGLVAAQSALRRFRRKYDFYWDGDSYFDD